MPIVDPEKAAEQAASTKVQRQKREANRQGAKGGTDKDDIIPVSESKILNLPETVTVRGLKLTLVCPFIAQAGDIQNRLFEEWPKIILHAVTSEMVGTGVSIPVVLSAFQQEQENEYREHVAERDSEGRDPDPKPKPVDREQIVAIMSALSLSMPLIVPRLCETMWPLISTSPNLRWPHPEPEEGKEPEPLPDGVEWLDEAIQKRFTPAGLADLLRALLACMGGYPGDAADRFL